MTESGNAEPVPFRLRPAEGTASAVVLDSPHSGFDWPPECNPAAPLDALRTTWDAHVDQLWGGAPSAGGTLLAATFPRAFIDLNRDVADIDAAMIEGVWPGALAPTDYSRRGMGLIRRDALPGVPMYAALLSVAEVQSRIDRYYFPYRNALRELLAAAVAEFGIAWHLNLHSMKSKGNAMNVDAGSSRPDVVVSDRLGTTADPVLTARIVGWFTLHGYRAQANDPYQGGDLVKRSGDPMRGRQSIQIELNRALYLDEGTMEPHAGFAPLSEDLVEFTRTFVEWSRDAAPFGR